MSAAQRGPRVSFVVGERAGRERAHEFRMRPIQRRLLVALIVVLSLVLLFAILFCVLVYNPFEGSVGSLVEIVPKGVSLYVTKPAPGSALRGFLSSPFLANLEECSSWKSFLDSATFRQLDEAYSIRSGVEQLLEAPRKAPIDIWEEVLGQEAALACFPRNDKVSRWDFLLYTRVGWKVRAGIDWSTSSLVASKLPREVSLADLEDGGVDATLRGGGKEHHLYYGRVRDVLILSNKEKLIGDALRLGAHGPGLSLQNEVEYRRSAATAKSAPDRLAVRYYGDIGKIRGEFGLDAMFEEAKFDPLLQVATKVLSPTRIRSSAGSMTLDDAPRFEGTFFLDERTEAEHEKRITSATPADVAAVESRYSTLVPSNAFFFGFVKCPASDLFALMSTQFGTEDRKLINDSLKKKNTNLDDFLARTASHFGDELAVSLSRIDYGGQPLPYKPFPAVTIYFQVADEAGLDEFIHFLTDDNFAIDMLEQREAAGLKYFHGVQKFPIISWAKDINYARVGDRWVLSSREDVIKDVLSVSAKQKPSLFEASPWKRASEALASAENAIAFVQMAPFLDWASDFSPYLAEKTTKITPGRWMELRPRVEDEVRNEHPNVAGPKFDQLVEERLKQMEEANVKRDIPEKLRTYREKIVWLRALGGFSAGLAFQPERFDLRMGLDFAFMSNSPQ